MSELKLEYNDDPETIDEGEKIEMDVSYCAICFDRIYAPILEGIWYHGGKHDKTDHQPIPANTLTQLFLQYKNDKGILLKIGKYEDKESLACPCFLKWFNQLKTDIESGFYGDHYYDKNGISMCKVYLIEISNKPITDPDYPEKQGYVCPECIKVIEKKKIIKIIPPTGKNKNDIYNRIEWLKK